MSDRTINESTYREVVEALQGLRFTVQCLSAPNPQHDEVRKATDKADAALATLQGLSPAQATLTLKQRVDELVAEHGGLRKAATVLRIDPGYLSRLRSGEKENPDDELLTDMGLRRVVSYERLVARAAIQAADKVQMPEQARAGIEVLHRVVESLLTTSRYVDEEGEATFALADMLKCIADPPFTLATPPLAPSVVAGEARKEVALLLNRLILMSSAKAQQTAADPVEDRITDADIDALEGRILALFAAPSGRQALETALNTFRWLACNGHDTKRIDAAIDSLAAALATPPAAAGAAIQGWQPIETRKDEA